MTIAIDFDGTIAQRAEFPAIGKPMEDVREVMAALKRDGHYLIIWTCRTGDDLVAAVNWLAEHEIPYHRINDNHPADIERYGGNSRKINADIYIDDRNLGGLPGWDQVLPLIGSPYDGCYP